MSTATRVTELEVELKALEERTKLLEIKIKHLEAKAGVHTESYSQGVYQPGSPSGHL